MVCQNRDTLERIEVRCEVMEGVLREMCKKYVPKDRQDKEKEIKDTLDDANATALKYMRDTGKLSHKG